MNHEGALAPTPVEDQMINPIINSEMVSRYPNFNEAQKDALDASALVADAIHNPDASGRAEVDNGDFKDGFHRTDTTAYEVNVLPVADPNTDSPQVRFTISRQVTPGLIKEGRNPAGRVEVTLDGGGRLIYANGYSTEAYGAPLQKHEIDIKDAKNAASEAIVMVKAANERRRQESK